MKTSKQPQQNEKWSIVGGMKRGECNECECSVYRGSKGPCQTCGHFPSNHKFLGVSEEDLQLEVQKKKEAQVRSGIIGTPFKEKDLEVSFNTPIWEQTVTDENGKRRFHGAFTGGFSAGYWNTVGSKEGWEPTQYKSSRTNRTKYQQTVYDIMDEEDRHDELSNSLKARKEYQAFGSTESELKNKIEFQETPFMVPKILNDLIVPSTDPIGKKLLRLMGWREGKGIGPRKLKKQKVLDIKKIKITKEEEPSSKKKKIIGPAIPQELQLERIVEAEYEEEDPYATNFTFAPSNIDVIEFVPKNDFYGIGYEPTIDHPPGLQRQMKEMKKSIVNLSDSLKKLGPSSGSKELGLGVFEKGDGFNIYGADDMSNYDFELFEENVQIKKKPPPEPEKSVSKLDMKRCSDGTFPLPNFHLSIRSNENNKWFEPPTLPKGWRPQNKVSISSKVETLEPSTTNNFMTSDNLTINAKQRGKLLGETPLPSKPVSVFEFLSPEDKSKLQSLTGKVSSGGVENSPIKEEPKLTEWEQQKRHSQETKSNQPLTTAFKPLTDMMAQRFTPAVHSTEYEAKSQQQAITAPIKPAFVKITRQTEEWYPTGLLCKRFNLKNPYKNKKVEKKPSTSQTTQVLNEIALSLPPTTITETPFPPSLETTEIPTDYHNLNKEKEEEENEEELHIPEKPSIDIFKAIFENDEDDSIPPIHNDGNTHMEVNDDTMGTLTINHLSTVIQPIVEEEKQSNILSNPIKEQELDISSRAENFLSSLAEELPFGPALPPSFSRKRERSSSNEEEESSVPKSKKSKKEKKHKKHKKEKRHSKE